MAKKRKSRSSYFGMYRAQRLRSFWYFTLYYHQKQKKHARSYWN